MGRGAPYAMHAVALCLVAVLAGRALAHKDRPLGLSASGEISGLPAEFEPAELRVGSTTARGVVIRFGTHELDLPPCITERFSWSQPAERFASASWYHPEGALPPYLLLRVPAKDGSKLGALLFSLKTAELLDVHYEVRSDDSITGETIDPDSVCSPEERRRLVPRKVEDAR